MKSKFKSILHNRNIHHTRGLGYDDAVHAQIEEVSAKKKYHNFEELLMTNDTWEVK